MVPESTLAVRDAITRLGLTRRHFIAINAPAYFHAGKKALDDVNDILRWLEFSATTLDRDQATLTRLLQAPLVACRVAAALLDRQSVVLLQAPLPSELRSLIRRLLRIRRARTIVLIHDIDA